MDSPGCRRTAQPPIHATDCRDNFILTYNQKEDHNNAESWIGLVPDLAACRLLGSVESGLTRDDRRAGPSWIVRVTYSNPWCGDPHRSIQPWFPLVCRLRLGCQVGSGSGVCAEQSEIRRFVHAKRHRTLEKRLYRNPTSRSRQKFHGTPDQVDRLPVGRPLPVHVPASASPATVGKPLRPGVWFLLPTNQRIGRTPCRMPIASSSSPVPPVA